MNHLDYYRFQAEARGIRSPADVRHNATAKAFIYERNILPWLPKERSAKMADLACGHGSFLCWLTEKEFDSVLGVDSSPEQVKQARSVGLKIIEENVMAWLEKQDDGTFKVLFAIDFIEHISKDDMMSFLQQCHRVLESGGLLILRYPNADSPLVGLNLFNDITHVWTYTSNCLGSLAKMHGYSGVRFADEGYRVARDYRWFKVPLGYICALLLQGMLKTVSRERINYWSSSIWAALEK